MLSILRLLPKNYLSYLFGKIAATKWPSWVVQPMLRWFVGRYQINLNEVGRPLTAFASLGEFFSRALPAGSRSIGDGLVSPVDGEICQFGEIQNGSLIQAKGKYFSVSTLLNDEQLARKFDRGYFITLYLAPRDYHGIHAPVEGTIAGLAYIPGTLWPVNQLSVHTIDGLFTVNERVITYLECNGRSVAVVKIGAFNVGSIRVDFDDVVSNTRRREPIARRYNPEPHIAKGARIGQFCFGSTVILLCEPGLFLPTKISLGGIRLGETLGTLQG